MDQSPDFCGRFFPLRGIASHESADLTLRGWLCLLKVGGLPCVEAAGEVGDFAEAGTAKDAGRDGAAIASLAVNDDELAGVEFAGSVGELAQRNSDGVFEGAGF